MDREGQTEKEERQERDWWSEQQIVRERERPSAISGRLQAALCMMLSVCLCDPLSPTVC